MKKNNYIKYLVIFSLILFSISGCAKREADALTDMEISDLITIQELKKETTGHVKCEGETSNELLLIDADIVVPERIMTGKVEGYFPDISLIEKNLCNREKMELINDSQWAIKAQGQLYDYEKYYAIDTDYAYYYNASLKGGTGNVEGGGDENLKMQADQVLNACEYPAVLSYEEKDDDEKCMSFFYTPSIDGVPVISKSAGIGGTQVYISSKGISEILMERQFRIVESNDTSILSLDSILELLQSYYKNGSLSPLNGDAIRFIRLAYYVNEKSELIPVWCFSVDFMNMGREYVVYCLDAITGDILFDYNNYVEEGEVETE